MPTRPLNAPFKVARQPRTLDEIIEAIRNKPQAYKSGRRVEIDGKFFRKRRGVLVEIPQEWLGKVTHPQTIRKRASKKNQGASFKPAAQR